jgi:cytochrome c biogenesis protein CcmG, thiol:disulfide interchange protein DsbE
MPRTLLFLLLATASLSPARTAKVTVGQPVPDFSVTTVDGNRVGPAELRGKRVLYFMWASW